MHSGSLCTLARALCCSSLVGGFTRVRPGVRCVYLRSLGSLADALGVVRYIRGRCVAPRISLRFIRGRRVLSRATWLSSRLLRSSGVVEFTSASTRYRCLIRGNGVTSRTPWGSLGPFSRPSCRWVHPGSLGSITRALGSLGTKWVFEFTRVGT